MAGSSDSADTEPVAGWVYSCLFLLFMGISIAWQIFIALITFLNSFYGGAKTIWLTRLKEEVLDVGVISLVLVFVYPYIAGICVDSSSSSSSYPSADSSYPLPPASAPPPLPAAGAPPSLPRSLLAAGARALLAGSQEGGDRYGQWDAGLQPAAAGVGLGDGASFGAGLAGGGGGRRRGLAEQLAAGLALAVRRALAGAGSTAECPEGQRHLFPAGSISNAHYLLFFVALVHIVYSLFTFTLTLQRFTFWSKWERRARLEAMDAAEVMESPEDEDGKRRCCGLCRTGCCVCCGTRSSPPTWYCRPFVHALRYLQGGIDRDRYMVLRGLFQLRSRAHRVKAFTDNLHYTNVCENAMEIDIAKMALIVAIFTLYPTVVYQILWIGGLSILIQVIVVAKMESVVSKVLRIVRVAGSQAAPVYHIDTAAEEYQELTDTSFDDEEEVPPSSSSSSSSEEWDYKRQRPSAGRVPSAGAAGSEHSRRALTMRAPEPPPLAGADAAARKFYSMDMRAADYSLASSYQHTHENGHHHHHHHHQHPHAQRQEGQGAGPRPAQGNGEHAGATSVRKRSSKRLEAAGDSGGGGSGGGGGVMSPPAQQELPRRQRSGGPVAEALERPPLRRRRRGSGGNPAGLEAAEAEAQTAAGTWLHCAPRGCRRRHGVGASSRRRPGSRSFAAEAEAEAEDGGALADTEGRESSSGDNDARADAAAARGGDGAGCSSSGSSGSSSGRWWTPAGAHGRRHGRPRRQRAAPLHCWQEAEQDAQAGRWVAGPGSRPGPGPVAEARDRSSVDRTAGGGGRSSAGGPAAAAAAAGLASSSSGVKSRSIAGALPVGGLTASVALKASNSGRVSAAGAAPPGAAGLRTSAAGARGAANRSEPGGGGLDGAGGGAPGSPGGADVFRAARNPLYDLEHLDADMEPELEAAGSGAGMAPSGVISLDAAMWAFTEDGEVRGSNSSAIGMVRMQPAAAMSAAAAATAAAAAAAAGRRGSAAPAGGGSAASGPNSMLETVGSGQGGSPRIAGRPPLAPAPSRGAAGGGGGGDGSGASVKYANPLFREGSMVSTSFTAAARAAALMAARNAASMRTTAPLEPGGGIDAAAVVAAGGQDPSLPTEAAAAEQRLRAGPSLKWKGPSVSGEAANGPSSAGPRGLAKVFSMKRSGTGARGQADAGGGGGDGSAALAAAAVGAGAAVATSAAVAAASAGGAGQEVGTASAAASAGPASAAGPSSGTGGVAGAAAGAPPQSQAQRRAVSATSGVSFMQQQPPPRAASPLARTAAGHPDATHSPGRGSASASGAHPAAAAGGAGAASAWLHHQHHSGLAGSNGSASAGQLHASATPRALAAAYASAGGGRVGSVTGRYASATGGAAAFGVHGSGNSLTGGGVPPTPGRVPKAAMAAYDVGLLNAGVAEVDMALVQRKLRALFWFRRPQILIWISHLNFLQNSLSLTLCIYYLFSYDTGTSILQVSSRLLYIWLPLLGANLAFMVYMGWVVVPLYTLVSTTCTRNPRALQSHIRRHKKAEAEEEGGITGFVLGLLTRCFMRSHHHTTRMAAKHGGSETTALNNLFMANLANQAGVIMASDAQLTNKKLGAAEAVYREYIDIWRAKARIAAGLEAPPGPDGFKLQADVSEFRSAFNALDADGSSTVTTDELFTHLHVLGTRATKTELKSMISQIDNDGDKRVDFDEFVVFMVFAIFDENGNSCVEIPDIKKMCRRVKLQVADEEVSAMMDLADPDGDRKIGLRQFFKLFKDVSIPELGPRPANAELHGLVLPAASISAAAAGSGPSRSAASRAQRNLSSPPYASGGSVSWGAGAGGAGAGGGNARSRLARATAVDKTDGGSLPPPRRPGSGSRKGLRRGGSHTAMGSVGGSESAGGSPSVSGKGGGFSAGGLAAAAAAASGSDGGPANDGSALLPEQLSPLRRGASQQQNQPPARGVAEIEAASAFGDEHENGHSGAAAPGAGTPELEQQGSKYRQLRVSLH
ncbi:hypothetical protein HXX76_000379 [Chlamydomonas incerta]|uniref:EF-hand domain-containing protein n=1 Tax=Chlamydomonas incerta TaxID=51695 RepID=A0A836B2H4_CHLIN|nr:hypothetical protein HXX76_000379 [Chlamydomonas incerta]|eukprot:KAG2445775.1 hypothetical protein HXX76_000379 [Chlamydomonas incerta]